jgi:hypothetical protein
MKTIGFIEEGQAGELHPDQHKRLVRIHTAIRTAYG